MASGFIHFGQNDGREVRLKRAVGCGVQDSGSSSTAWRTYVVSVQMDTPWTESIQMDTTNQETFVGHHLLPSRRTNAHSFNPTRTRVDISGFCIEDDIGKAVSV